MAKKQTAAWAVFVQSTALSLGVYLLLVLLLTLLLVKGTLPEKSSFPAVGAMALLSALAGGLVSVRRGPWGRLPNAMVPAAGFAAVLAVVGYLCWESGVTWLGQGGGILLCVLAGGLLAGVLGGKRGRRVKRKVKRH